MRWEMLNAYVDGELPPDASWAVREAAHADPALAARIATLTRLKGVARHALAPHARRARPAAIRRRALAGWGLASAALCGLALLLIGPSAPPNDPAVAAYEAWSRMPSDEWMRREAVAVPVAAGIPAPDLSGAGPTLVHQAGTLHGRLTAYAGPHGCRLALWTGDAISGPFTAGEGLQVVGWQVGERRYVVLTRGMEASRLARIAAAIEAFTRASEPPRLALNELGGASPQPCTG